MDNERDNQQQAQPQQQRAPRQGNMNRGRRRKVCAFCADKIEHIDYTCVAATCSDGRT